jgi:hypothetical protein
MRHDAFCAPKSKPTRRLSPVYAWEYAKLALASGPLRIADHAESRAYRDGFPLTHCVAGWDSSGVRAIAGRLHNATSQRDLTTRLHNRAALAAHPQ